jgi:pyruvate kinase
MILVDDGKIELKVKEVKATEVLCTVVYGGPLKSRKGINLPFSKVSAPSLTDKDYEDLEFGLKNTSGFGLHYPLYAKPLTLRYYGP